VNKASLVYSPRWADFSFGEHHPMQPERIQRAYDLMKAYRLLDRQGISTVEPAPATDEDLTLCHSKEYVQVVRFLSSGGSVAAAWRYGLGTADNPVVPEMYEASALSVGATMRAADLVLDGEAEVAFNLGGGLHHAHQERAAGFCVFNDLAIAIAHMLRKTNNESKVAYVDIDAHHGDGVQEAFYDCDRVLTISVHESGRFLFPGTGAAEEIGRGRGEGYAVNLPLAPFTDDEIYLWAFGEVVVPLVESFQADVLVTQLGVDTHYMDPLAHMCLTTDGFLGAVRHLKRLARGRWVATAGGGYDSEVVARCWTLAFAEMAEVNLRQNIPKSQAANYPSTSGRLRDQEGPELNEEQKGVARTFAEHSVATVRRLVFPHHGL
jgi:acetoin utilization protein AcuC